MPDQSENKQKQSNKFLRIVILLIILLIILLLILFGCQNPTQNVVLSDIQNNNRSDKIKNIPKQTARIIAVGLQNLQILRHYKETPNVMDSNINKTKIAPTKTQSSKLSNQNITKLNQNNNNLSQQIDNVLQPELSEIKQQEPLLSDNTDSSEEENQQEEKPEEKNQEEIKEEAKKSTNNQNVWMLSHGTSNTNNQQNNYPKITNFTLSSIATTASSTLYTPSTTVNVNIDISDISDQVKEYLISNSSVVPTSTNEFWTSVKPTNFILESGDGNKTAYLWLKYLDDNISTSTADTIILDTTAPTSSIGALEQKYNGSGFSVVWSGNDNGAVETSGINSYDLEYKICPLSGCSTEIWNTWITSTTSVSAVFNITVDKTSNVYFHSRAVDNAGNIGQWSSDAQTQIVIVVPVVAVDNTSNTQNTTQNNPSALIWNHVISESNEILFVNAHLSNGIITDVMYNNIALNLAAETNNAPSDVNVQTWYLINPPVGTNSIKISFNEPDYTAYGSAISLKNIDINNPIIEIQKNEKITIGGYFGLSTNLNIPIGSMVIDALTWDNQDQGNITATDSTEYFNYYDSSTPPPFVYSHLYRIAALSPLPIILHATASYKPVEVLDQQIMGWTKQGDNTIVAGILIAIKAKIN